MSFFPLVAEAAQSSRQGKVLIGPVDLTLDGRGTTVVIGPNGSGKTSLLRLLHGAARLTGGQIRWACSREEAQHEMAFVFQRPVMLRRSVMDNIAYPLLVRGVRRAEAMQQARDWAARIGLGAMLERQATVLSGGEQQKLALARALITKPKLLFLDEPCAALDGRSVKEIETILGQAKTDGTALIMTTHDMGQARRLADDIVFLLKGKVHEQSPAKQFFETPRTDEAQAFLRGDILE